MKSNCIPKQTLSLEELSQVIGGCGPMHKEPSPSLEKQRDLINKQRDLR